MSPSASMPPMNSATAIEAHGDREVVPELAIGIDEGPAIGAHHQRGIGGVDQRHAGGEQGGEHQHMRERGAARGFGGGDAEQADLGRGVEAEPEQQAERIHVPRFGNEAEHRAEQARQESTGREQRSSCAAS